MSAASSESDDGSTLEGIVDSLENQLSSALEQEGFSLRELASGDYALSTSEHTYILEESTVSHHRKGRTDESEYSVDVESALRDAYNAFDIDITDKLPED